MALQLPPMTPDSTFRRELWGRNAAVATAAAQMMKDELTLRSEQLSKVIPAGFIHRNPKGPTPVMRIRGPDEGVRL